MIAALSTFETGQFFSASPAMRAKPAVVEVGHLASQGECGLADLEFLAVRIQRDGGLGGELRRVEPRRLQAERQCHRETSGMRSRDQFFGIRALIVLEAGLEGIRGTVEYT